MNKELILILGSFNPPTVAHVAMGRVLHDRFPSASVLYLPSNERYLTGWKGLNAGQMMPMEDRVRLLSGAVDPAYAGVSDAEGDAEKTDGRTWNTAEYFRESTGAEVILALGADNLPKLSRWYKGRELAEKYRFAVFCRGTGSLPAELSVYKEHFLFLPFSYEDISSSQVRKAYVEGRLSEVRSQLPENVYLYLSQNSGVYL
ncbi:MAG: hypothetical protein IK115_05695 [Lachnospiraceae bacterium]|nr:hypothetical protein [Lachnospiraceae bacterium]